MKRSNGYDLVNLIYDILQPLGYTMYKFAAPAQVYGEYLTINYIPVRRDQAVSVSLLNVNAYIPKIDNGSGFYPDSLRCGTVMSAITTAIESFGRRSKRVPYYGLLIETEPTVFNEDENYSMINIRVTSCIT